MCDTCGCNITPGNKHLVEAGGKFSHSASGHESVEVLQNLLSENDHQADHNREHFHRHGVLVINLMSSPGAGKTSLLRIICGLLEPTTGEALWRGQGVTELREEFGRQLIYLGHLMEFGDRAFFSTLTELLHATQLWQQRLDKLPPSCD